MLHSLVSLMRVNLALLSVYDKTGLLDFARGLRDIGVDLLSTGGTAQMLSDLSGPGPAVPIDIFNDIVARWLAADEYFKDVAHHQRNNVNEAEFATHMTFIENFLLQRLQPQAIADQDVIDALIAEAEHGQ